MTIPAACFEACRVSPFKLEGDGKKFKQFFDGISIVGNQFFKFWFLFDCLFERYFELDRE